MLMTHFYIGLCLATKMYIPYKMIYIDALTTWATKWQMSFNPKETEFLRTTNKINPLESCYYLQNIPIPTISHAKCPGVIINRNLNWNQYVKMITSKANSVRDFLQ